MRSLYYCISSVLLFCCGVFGATAKTEYIGQTFIDTSIQSAFYNFTAAGSEAGAPMNQTQAIAYGKGVVAKLKKLAAGDPNEKYILWKLSELEAQIYLEEKDVLLKKMYQNTVATNDLIAKFNAETGKQRPDFAVLVAIQNQTADVHAQKGDNLWNLLDKRRKALSREVPYIARQCLDKGDFDGARREVDWLKKNRRYLVLDNNDIASIENRMLLEESTTNIREAAAQSLARLLSSVQFFDVGTARNEVFLLESLLDKKRLGDAETRVYQTKLASQKTRIVKIEDSLVARATELSTMQGFEPAIEFVNKVLRPRGISRERIAAVENALAASGGTSIDKIDTIMQGELARLSNADEGGISLDDISARARAKAQARADSTKAAQEAEYRRTHAAEIAAAEKAEKEKAAVVADAGKAALEIRTFLDRNKPGRARAILDKKRSVLSAAGRLLECEDAVNEAETAQRTAEQEAAKVKPVKTAKVEKAPVSGPPAIDPMQVVLELYAMIEGGDVSGASSRFSRDSVALVNGLPSEVVEGLRATITAAVAPIPVPVQEEAIADTTGQGGAEKAIGDIYALIEQNRVKEARYLFGREKENIRKNSCVEAYDAIAATLASIGK